MHEEVTGEDAEGVVEVVDGQEAVLVNFGHSRLWLDPGQLTLVRRKGQTEDEA
jgi:hypothetical protein